MKLLRNAKKFFMMKSIMLIVFLSLLTSCVQPGIFHIRLSVKSESGYGVIIHDLPAQRKTKEIKLSGSGITLRGGFIGYGKAKLPDDITIRYQYVSLNDCFGVYEKKGYTYKHSCKTWEPIGDIITQTIDLTPYQNHEYLKKVRRTFGVFSKYRGTLSFIFYDDQKIETEIYGKEISNFKN